jgi:hypothetical protein
MGNCLYFHLHKIMLLRDMLFKPGYIFLKSLLQLLHVTLNVLDFENSVLFFLEKFKYMIGSHFLYIL